MFTKFHRDSSRLEDKEDYPLINILKMFRKQTYALPFCISLLLVSNRLLGLGVLTMGLNS